MLMRFIGSGLIAAMFVTAYADGECVHHASGSRIEVRLLNLETQEYIQWQLDSKTRKRS